VTGKHSAMAASSVLLISGRRVMSKAHQLMRLTIRRNSSFYPIADDVHNLTTEQKQAGLILQFN
jgi:hypothetical protein